jgi:hypothetical protein
MAKLPGRAAVDLPRSNRTVGSRDALVFCPQPSHFQQFRFTQRAVVSSIQLDLSQHGKR